MLASLPRFSYVKHSMRSSTCSRVSVRSLTSAPGMHIVTVRDRISFSRARVRLAAVSITIFRSSTDSVVACAKSFTLSGVTSVLMNLRMRFYCFAIVADSSNVLIKLWILALVTESHNFSVPSTNPFFVSFENLSFCSISTMEKSLNYACVLRLSLTLAKEKAIGTSEVRHWEIWDDVRQCRKMDGTEAI